MTRWVPWWTVFLSGCADLPVALDGAPADPTSADSATPGSSTAPDAIATTRSPPPTADTGDPPAVVWPTTATTTPGCMQDPFGFRLLSGRPDFHPGWDSCDHVAQDEDTNPPLGVDVHAIADGIVTRVRRWDPAWDEDPDLCEDFCRQGTFIQIRHPSLEPDFGGEIVQSVYMHLAHGTVPESIRDGVWLRAGDRLGNMGRSGNRVNKLHLHLGILVGSPEGLIHSEEYVHPLRVLPYDAPLQPTISATLEPGAAAFDPEECTRAEASKDVLRTLAIRLEEWAPAFDTVRLEVTIDGKKEPWVLELDGPDGIIADEDSRDDFEQGCVAVDVRDYNPQDSSRLWTIRAGGAFDAVKQVTVVRIEATGARDERVLTPSVTE